MMNENSEKKDNKVIIVIVIIILICSVGLNIYFVLNDSETKCKQVENSEKEEVKKVNDEKEEEKKEESKEEDDKECPPTVCNCPSYDKNEITAADIKSIYMSYFKGGNFVDEDNLQSWNIEKVTYVGNYKNTNKRVYNVTGYYVCKDKETDCIYQEQSEDADSNGKVSFSNTFDVEVKSDGSLIFVIMDNTYGADSSFEAVNQQIE